MWRTLTLMSAAVLLVAAESPGYAAYQRANALFVAKKFPECEAAIDEALRLDVKLVPALTLKAKLAMAINRFDVARDSLKQTIESDPRSSYAWFLYGLQFYMTNDLQSAMPQFEKSRALNPSDPRAVLYLGLTRESLGQTADAMSRYEEAVRLEKAAGAPHADTLLVGARLLLRLGNVEESDRWIQEALKLGPDSRDAHFEKARVLMKKGEASEAAAEGETALRLKEGSTQVDQIHYLLVRAYRDSGQADKAARHVELLRLSDVQNK
jgi:tetratricopeptide (TPR) repeat protein